MVDQDITTVQAIKDSRMTNVLILLFTNPGMKIADACSQSQVEYNEFRYWERTHPEFIANMRGLLGEYQREQVLELQMAWTVGLKKLSEALMSEETGLAARMELHKYLTGIRDDLLRTYHAEPGVEEEAQKFLTKGPNTKQQQSRFASVEISKTAEGVRLDLFEDAQILEAEFQQESSQKSTDSPDE